MKNLLSLIKVTSRGKIGLSGSRSFESELFYRIKKPLVIAKKHENENQFR